MKVAWVCEYPASSFPDRPALAGAPPSHPVPWIVVQAPAVVASGVELHVVTVSKNITADDEFERDGIHFHFLKIPALPRAALAYQLDRSRIVARLRRIGPDVVQGFGTESSFGYAAVSSSLPSVLMIQGIVSRIVRARGVMALVRQPGLLMSIAVEWLTVRRARHVICETAFAAEFVHGYNPSAITHIVRTPIHDDWFGVARLASGDPEVVFVGWVVPAKGVDALVMAFAPVAAAFPNATLHVIGAADDRFAREVLTPMVARLGLAERVRFHGSQPASFIANQLARATVLVLPTLMDTAPNVLAEARACGVPVIASAVGGVPELIDNGVDGLLVPAGAPDALGAAILGLLRDPVRAQAMAVRGRARVAREHRLATQVPTLLQVYRDALASAKAVPA